MKIIKTYVRLYVSKIDDVLPFYERLFGEKAAMRFRLQSMNLELAGVGNVLLVAGNEEALRPIRPITVTYVVDSVHDFMEHLKNSGASIVRGPTAVPAGRNMTVRHPDGTVAEYVEYHS